MSLYGGMLDDYDDDPFFGAHMRTMRHMNNMMNSLFADPFSMMRGFDAPALTAGPSRAMAHHTSLTPFGFPMMPNINRLLSGSLDSLANPPFASDCHSYSSSTVVSMTSGPDGRPQVYRASSSTRTAPGGIKETQKTECDSRTGTKKMAIGHHIGERAHIVAREQNVHTGEQVENQDFINLEEEEADDFNREWETRSRSRSEIPRLVGSISGSGGYQRPRHSQHSLPAITAGPQSSRRNRYAASPLVSPRRSIRSPALALPSSSSSPMTSTSRNPYSPPGHSQPRKHRNNIKTVSGSPAHDI